MARAENYELGSTNLALMIIGGVQILSMFIFLTLGDLWAAVTGRYPMADDLWGYEDT